MAQITGHVAGKLHHFMHDVHVYENQIDMLKVQVSREPMALPTMLIDNSIQSLEDLLYWATIDNFYLVNYKHHEAIKYPMAV